MNADFYDQLAPYYHLLYSDWESSVARQGEALASLLRQAGIAPGEAILDAASGIGTQTLGLLQQGYRVNASDISPGAIARLKTELSIRGLHARVHVDDLRTLAHTEPGSMAAVIACDNSIPHLLTDDEILQSFHSCFRCVRPGGIVILSVRDYTALERISPDVRPYGLRHESGHRFLAVSIERLLSLLAEAGFVCAQRRDDVLFQPVLLARRPADNDLAE